MKYKIQPWKHQLKAIEASIERDSYALFFEVGTGKTLTMINILREKFHRKGGFLPTLILCPLITMENWKRELIANSEIRPSDILKLEGTGEKRLATLSRKLESTKQFIAIVNYESLTIKKLFAAIMEWSPIVLILDESHYCKNISTRRTKSAIAIADRAKYKYLMSGTPVLNSPLDLFSQYRIMDSGESFGKNYFVFRGMYFYDKNAGMPSYHKNTYPDWRLYPNSLERFSMIIDKTAAVAKKSECLDLPPLIKKKVFVELSKEQRKLYEEMKKDLITFLDGAACTAPLAITKSLRLQQIVSGYVIGEDEEGNTKEVILENNPREEALEELLHDLAPNHKIIIWAIFKNNYESIRKVCSRLKVRYVEVHGEVANKEKFENVDKFNLDKEVRVLIGHPGAGGIGINLTASDVSIFYSRGFSLGHDIQAEARNYRGGSEIHKSIIRYDLIAQDTIDEVILEALENKMQISDKLLKENRDRL